MINALAGILRERMLAGGNSHRRTRTSALAASPHVSTYQWNYDDAGRLIDEVIDHWDDDFDQTEHFEYDLTGNRTKLTRDLGNNAEIDQTITYLFDANDRLAFEWLDGNDLGSDADQTTQYEYDQTQQTSKTVLNGNKQPQDTTDPNRLTRQTFGYNLQGRMSSVINDTFNGLDELTSRERTSYTFDSKSYRIKIINESDVVTNGVAAGTWTKTSSTEFLADHHTHTGYTQTIRETEYDGQGNVTKTIDYTVKDFGIRAADGVVA